MAFSIHLEEFFKTDIKFKNDVIAKKWEKVKDVRKVITGALEVKRADKTIGSSLESHVDIYLSKEINSIIENIDMAEIAITSSATIMVDGNHSSGFSLEDIKNVVVDVKKAKGTKCKRCWKFDSEINTRDICKRCSGGYKKIVCFVNKFFFIFLLIIIDFTIKKIVYNYLTLKFFYIHYLFFGYSAHSQLRNFIWSFFRINAFLGDYINWFCDYCFLDLYDDNNI